MSIDIELVQKPDEETRNILNNYNELQREDPATLARVLAQRALGAPHAPADNHIVEQINNLLGATNGGQGFTFGDREERVWDEVYKDPEHKKWSSRYHEANTAKDIEKARQACWKRGHHALRVIARLNDDMKNLSSQEKELALTSN